MHDSLELNGLWSLAYSDTEHDLRDIDGIEKSGLKAIAATVPGNFELDLEAAGEIGDPFFGMNMAGLRRWERCHWWYARRFTVHGQAGKRAMLRFEGMDCYARVYFNGQLAGECDNALIEQEFPVHGLLRDGENELVVHIRPAAGEAAKFAYPPALAAQRSNYESLYVRKPQHCFGWDIMPRAVSGGMWRPVSLVFLPEERLKDVFLRTGSADQERACLILHYQFRSTDAEAVYEIEVDGECGAARFHARGRALFDAGRLTFEAREPALWWPRGRGTPALYDTTVRLFKNGAEIDRSCFRHGIRTVELERTSVTDSAGNGKFCFIVNGERFFALGTNWVPADAFHSRDAARSPRILALAEEAGCNMIRCWGGNVYESDAFFDLCDEKGFLVWQDFAFGCAIYPQDEAFAKRVGEEARSVVRRLRRHACLALWAGDNECDQAYSWHSSGDPNTNVLTRQVLRGVVRMEDPGRVYLPSSPYIDETAFAAGEAFLPENHLWGPRNGFKSSYYKDALCHFASEIGYHGCPSPDSVRRFISPEKLWPPGNDEWLLHATSPVPGVDINDYRIELMRKQVYEFFGTEPDNLEDFALQSQCVQAEALKFFIEWFRAAKWRRTGIIWWNLCDGWPQFSDAVVDYYFAKKMAFDFISRCQKPLCLVLREAAEWKHELVACNDTRSDVSLSYSVSDVETGEVLCQGSAVAQRDMVTRLDAIYAFAAEKRFLLIEWDGGGERGRNHYLAGSSPFEPAVYLGWVKKAGLL